MKTGRSPLKQPPLHNPGESLVEQRFDLFGDQILPLVAMTIMLIMLTCALWAVQLGWITLRPGVFTVITIGFCIYTFWKFKKVMKKVHLVNRGLSAEKAVGQFLEQFRAKNYAVFHDIPVEAGDKKFNIDHLLVGPKGIFTIETKYRKKPLSGECKVKYDGTQISINGQAPDRDPIAQALGQAAWVQDYLKSCTALASVPVTPLVVFPGWYVDYLQAGNANVKVTNEQLIWACIQSSPHQLAPHDAKLVESRLAKYIQRRTSLCPKPSTPLPELRYFCRLLSTLSRISCRCQAISNYPPF